LYCDKILPRPIWFVLAVELGLCFKDEVGTGVNCFCRKIAMNIAVMDMQNTETAVLLHTWKIRGPFVPIFASSLLWGAAGLKPNYQMVRIISHDF